MASRPFQEPLSAGAGRPGPPPRGGSWKQEGQMTTWMKFLCYQCDVYYERRFANTLKRGNKICLIVSLVFLLLFAEGKQQGMGFKSVIPHVSQLFPFSFLISSKRKQQGMGFKSVIPHVSRLFLFSFLISILSVFDMRDGSLLTNHPLNPSLPSTLPLCHLPRLAPSHTSLTLNTSLLHLRHRPLPKPPSIFFYQYLLCFSSCLILLLLLLSVGNNFFQPPPPPSVLLFLFIINREHRRTVIHLKHRNMYL